MEIFYKNYAIDLNLTYRQGFSMSVMSAFNALVNGVLLSPITNYFQHNFLNLIKYCNLWMFIFYGVQYAFAASTFGEPFDFLNGYYPFIGTCIVLSMFQYVLATVITSESTTRVDVNSKGTLIGLEHSLFALARIWTPQIGLAVLTWGGVPGVSGVCGSVFLGTYLVWASLAGGTMAGVKSSQKCLGEEKKSM